MVEAVDIAGRKVGPGEPCFIIAEAGFAVGYQWLNLRRFLSSKV